MADTRNFEINIPVVKKAGENIFDCGDKIRNAADEIESICKHLSGTSSLSSVAESLLALQSKLYGNASKMNALGNGTLQCMHFYESAEASLLGQDICDYEERKSAERPEPSPVPSETDKPGDPGQEKGTPSKQESTDSKSMTSCWVEDFDYINAYNEESREYFSGHKNVTYDEMAGPARLYTYNPKELANKIGVFMQKEQ